MGMSVNLTPLFAAGNLARLQAHHTAPHHACHLHRHINMEDSPGKRCVGPLQKSFPTSISTGETPPTHGKHFGHTSSGRLKA